MKDDKIYIEHILHSIERIGSCLEGKDHQFFSDDYLTQDAVLGQLEITGEATKPDLGGKPGLLTIFDRTG
jgi:uncharacterized protein with HEPN domain